MCGIVGYVGQEQACPILIKALKKLEYRGYDSSGIALSNGEIHVYKKKGKVAQLVKELENAETSGTIGIGHTRWATHGEPNDRNAHPHQSQHGVFTIIHNGIIENCGQLRTKLENKHYQFISETDTEILANLFEYIYLKEKTSPEEAIGLALSQVVGAYGLVILCRDVPHQLMTTRRGSPIVVGVAENAFFVASDASPIIEYTDRVIYLNDGDLAILNKSSLFLKTLNNNPLSLKLEKVNLKLGNSEKGDFPHYMLKEIFEQPQTITDTFRGRLNTNTPGIKLGGIREILPELERANRIIMPACGTSWHAALIGEYLFEELARIPVEVEYASEFRYRSPIIHADDAVLAVSQSGETADTLAAIRMLRENKNKIMGICNVVGSSLSRETDAGVYTHAGQEIGVASTKAFTAQVTALFMTALALGQKRGTISPPLFQKLVQELGAVPEKITTILGQNQQIESIAKACFEKQNFLYLGRSYQYPVALEGALKLKEISYAHAEGYPAAEMKHGPIALIENGFPCVFLATRDPYYEKIVNNIQEVNARKGTVIAVVTEGDTCIPDIAEHIIEIPASHYTITPLLSVIPLQLLAYYIAVLRGCNVDKPRNLAKSVTVE